MSRISREAMVRAIPKVRAMNAKQKEALADELFRRALAVRHIEEGECGMQIVDMTLRGRIEFDEDADGHAPLVVVDGREISWDQLGRILAGYEGWQFKLEILDSSDEA